MVAAGLVVVGAVFWYFRFHKKRVRVYHVGAVKKKLNELEGQKLLVYGFVKPVYGRAVRLVGYGGTIKGRSKLYPREGKVFEGVLRKGIFWVDEVVEKVPSNWQLEWVSS